MALTRRNAEFVKQLKEHPEISNAQAVLNAGYNPNSMVNASKIGTQLLQKPEVQSALQEFTELVEGAIVQTVRDWKDNDQPRKREIAMQNAQYIHDKVHGRSKQQIDMNTRSVTLSIDLTGSLEEPTTPEEPTGNATDQEQPTTPPTT